LEEINIIIAMTYIEFEMPFKSSLKAKERDTFIKIFISFLLRIFPRANPDYDHNIETVYKWLLEFEDENACPIREIGLNKNEEVILKMPFKNNVGYWTDNNMNLADFKLNFKVTQSNFEYFEKKWKML
jgi:hypothetical protein